VKQTLGRPEKLIGLLRDSSGKGLRMSCRIDRVVIREDLDVLCISGRIIGDDVDMLRGVLEQESGGFAIDLKNVLLVDREAVRLLALREANGTELRNCPPYIREWVTREKEERTSKYLIGGDR
jgi:hypothetical protein